MPPKAARSAKSKSMPKVQGQAALDKIRTEPAVEQVEDAAVRDSDYDSDATDESDIPDRQEFSEKRISRLMKSLGSEDFGEAGVTTLATLQGEGDEDDESDEDDDDDDDENDDNVDNDDDEEEEENGDEEEAHSGSKDVESKPKPSTRKDTLAASLTRSGLISTSTEENSDGNDEDKDDEDSEDADESDILVDSLTDDAFAALPDVVRSRRFHKERTNNRAALEAVREAIALDPSDRKVKRMEWIEHMSLTWDRSLEEELKSQGASAEDDLKRELAFYRQALSAAVLGKCKVEETGIPFSRPSDFFAEMVKSDSHMERVRQRLLDEKAGIETSEEAKRQRELKKFGKQVQVQKRLQRQKEKREMEDKVKSLKRKRGGGVDAAADDGPDNNFDVRLEDALSDGSKSNAKRRSAPRRARKGPDGRAKVPRTTRDEKYGFGGKKRFSKSNTKDSTEGGFGKYQAPGKKKRGAGGKGQRPGKSKRAGH